ncbi:hypothetical protein HRbin17_02828 [bacterium HR17]|uniref:Glycosyltransferase RgtA/B/C/D-like domain-containing protein n=1 Tax=Candidatus Fervidibacter japonicus TaxID=2035412 RepID=A0A2H5XGK2_9BACT|nr:hypothetical protein HRbin17_02828 [bacterium HR17]
MCKLREPNIGKVGVAIVLTGHILFALIYQWLIPLGYGPDEPRHYGYIQHLVLYRALPRLGDPTHPYYCHMDPRPPNAIGIHPPLYYTLLAPVYALLAGQRIDHPAADKTPFAKLEPSRSKFVQHILRTCSLVMALMTLFVVARIALLFPEDSWWLLGTVGFVAWLPHFLLLSAVMNNDTVTMLLGHLFLFLLARQTLAAGEPLRDAALLGSAFGGLGLSKASALAWSPLLLFGAWQVAKRASAAQRWRCVALALGLPVLLCGWWYARFYALYGRIMPIVKWTENPELLLSTPTDLLWRPDAWALVARFLAGVTRSLWGQVDWFILKPEHIAAWQKKFGTAAETAYPLTEPIWLLLVLFSLVAVVGWVVKLVKWLKRRQWTPRHQAGALLAAGFVLLFLALMHYTLFTHPGGYEGGRYLLPSIGAFAFLFWRGLMGLVPDRWRPALVCGVLGALLALNIGCVINLHYFLNPLYA